MYEGALALPEPTPFEQFPSHSNDRKFEVEDHELVPDF
jgi:hypothetical protein